MYTRVNIGEDEREIENFGASPIVILENWFFGKGGLLSLTLTRCSYIACIFQRVILV